MRPLDSIFLEVVPLTSVVLRCARAGPAAIIGERETERRLADMGQLSSLRPRSSARAIKAEPDGLVEGLTVWPPTNQATKNTWIDGRNDLRRFGDSFRLTQTRRIMSPATAVRVFPADRSVVFRE
jgi:hypothetical protein